MNERIKQIWEEAAKTTQGDSWEEQTKFMERFAEFIVADCIELAGNHYDARSAVNDIKQHFGVEE